MDVKENTEKKKTSRSKLAIGLTSRFIFFLLPNMLLTGNKGRKKRDERERERKR